MGKRCVDLADSETENVTPAKAPRRLKLTYSVPKDVKRGRKGLSPEAKSEKSGSTSTSATSRLSVLANTPSRLDDIREEQERRFRLAVCQSAGAILRSASRNSSTATPRRMEIYAYHAVQLYFMQKSFRHANFEVATLTAAFKALKDSGSALSEDDLIKELREQNAEARVEVRAEQLRQETALLEEYLRSTNGTTRCIDLISLVDTQMERLLEALTSEHDLDKDIRQAVREAARSFAVDSMFGPAALEFRPEILAAVVVAMGARWVLPDAEEEILKQIHRILQENTQSSDIQQEIRQAVREVTQTLKLQKQR